MYTDLATTAKKHIKPTLFDVDVQCISLQLVDACLPYTSLPDM